ncbi:MAG: Si-specific NAD(P)(+) transhydrogenase [Novosphingobium sp.]|uniref:Si-specific NAD(P)(+) transhydrogenase n=1 Tax=Novosphingobium sp. TaxID=1874826 RepID=UPI0032BE9862
MRYDLVVLGSGPAGRRAAVQAAKLGKSVLVVDNRDRVGGVSVHTGTIPSKTLRETALNLSGWRERGFYGRAYRVKRDISGADLAMRLDKTLTHEIEVLEHQFARNGVQTLVGAGRFLDPHRIAISAPGGERVVEAGRILIAVGTQPFRPDSIPFDGRSIVDSDEFIANPRVPRSLTVIGAGVIGLEYATVFAAMDVPVTLVEPRRQLLEFIDQEVVEHLVYQLRDSGMRLLLGTELDRIVPSSEGPVCHLADGRQLRSEMVLYTAGRQGATAPLDLARCGLEADPRGRLRVDPATYQTDIGHIYAAGDVIGFPSLAATSMEQGRAAACHAFCAPLPKAGSHFPIGIYAVPELSSAGLSEEAAREQGLAYECGVARFRETSRGQIMGMDSGMLKLIFAMPSRKLLGVHIVGEGATELVHIGQAVIELGGTIDYFIDNSFNYPTLAEAYKIASLDAWNRIRHCSAEVVEIGPRAIRQ